MRKHIKTYILLSLYLLPLSLFSQQKIWIFLTDKGSCATGLSPREYQDLPVSKDYMSLLKELGCKVYFQSRWLNAVSIESAIPISQLVETCPFIKEVRPVQKLSAAREGNTEPALEYGRAERQNNMLNIKALHQKGLTGKGVRVAVLDAGFFGVDTIPAFQAAWKAGQFKHWYDFKDKDRTVFDEDKHGLQVLSTIVANEPGKMVGTAPDIDIFLARTEVSESETHVEEDYWLAAMEWADSLGVQIIHTSLGYSTFDKGEGDYSYEDMNGQTAVITRAAKIAASRGILVVTSAGNEGNDPWKYITAPCDADSVLCVGAVDAQKRLAVFSSIGPTADGRIKPDVVAMGAFTITIGKTGKAQVASGTSYSAPMVAGLAACLWQGHPSRSNMEVIDAIKRSADRYTTPDTNFGCGIPNAAIADSLLAEMDKWAEVLAKSNMMFRDNFEIQWNKERTRLTFKNKLKELKIKHARLSKYPGDTMQNLRFSKPRKGKIKFRFEQAVTDALLIQFTTDEGRLIYYQF